MYLIIHMANENTTKKHLAAIEGIATTLRYTFDNLSLTSGLHDTPSGYLGHSGDYLVVNNGESGIHFTGIEKIASDLTDYGFLEGNINIARYSSSLPNPIDNDGKIVASGCDLYYGCDGEWKKIGGDSTDGVPEDSENIPLCVSNLDEYNQYQEYVDGIVADNLDLGFSAGFENSIVDRFFSNVCLFKEERSQTDNTFIDLSDNAFPVSIVGNPTNDSSVTGPYGSSVIHFNGVSNEIGHIVINESSNNEALNPGTEDFTLECWFKFKTLSSSTLPCQIMYKGSGSANWQVTSSLSLAGNQKLRFVNNLATTSNIMYWDSGDPEYFVNNWTHVAVVRHGTVITMYVNGVDRFNFTVSSTDAVKYNTNSMMIGSSLQFSTYKAESFYVQDFRYSSAAMYTENFTPPTDFLPKTSDTQLLLQSDVGNPIAEGDNIVKITESTFKWGVFEDGTTINIESPSSNPCTFSNWKTSDNSILGNPSDASTTALINQDTSITGVFNC